MAGLSLNGFPEVRFATKLVRWVQNCPGLTGLVLPCPGGQDAAQNEIPETEDRSPVLRGIRLGGIRGISKLRKLLLPALQSLIFQDLAATTLPIDRTSPRNFTGANDHAF